SEYIKPGHLLLGVMREDKELASNALHAAPDDISDLQNQLFQGAKVSTSVDLPLSQASKRVLAYGAEESERMNSQHIGTEHVLMGLVREDDPVVTPFLKSRSVTLESLRQQALMPQPEKEAERRTAMGMLHRTLERMGRGAGSFHREGDGVDGHFSASTIE